ncbi:protein IWS1 homolog 2-like [Hibiscus syriacus]|uniref:protein IWS1 homolog 2-like n=1 Tax=Hibiscus syriacus TaxID=106335 RepID=UPI001922D157|nr:protein IWS1 homolog 2-like [Hibiscus syriacus]
MADETNIFLEIMQNERDDRRKKINKRKLQKHSDRQEMRNSDDQNQEEVEEICSKPNIVKDSDRFKRRKTTTEEDPEAIGLLVEQVMSLMEVAAEEDIELNRQNKPAIKKIQMLPLLTYFLSEKHLQQEFLDHGILSLFKNWLQPLPDGSLPNATLRASISNIYKIMFKKSLKKQSAMEAREAKKSRSSNQQDIEAIDPEEPTEEDMNTFFSSLESKLSSSKIDVSQEEAREALAKLDEAMNMTPVEFYNSGQFSPLKNAFKILAGFNSSSTTLTIEQKNELLGMEESLKELADRAAKAVEDKNNLREKESMKQTISHNLDSNLVKYKEMGSEVKRVEQILAAFHELVEEAEKERENIVAEQKGIFRSSKKMKMELEALEEKWEEYEAKAKVAEKEEKTVEAEWGRIKYFISSVKEKM